MKFQTSLVRKRGFTLIELIVAVAILMGLLMILFQITGSMLQTGRLAHQKMNAAHTARSILDAIGSDLAQLVNQRGFSVFVRPAAAGAVTNTDFALLTQGRSQRNESPPRFADVQYHAANGTVSRSVAGVPWTNSSLVQAISSSTGSATTSELGGGVLRLAAVAVLDDGSLVSLTTAKNAWSSDTVNGISIPDNYQALRLKSVTDVATPNARRVRAIVIAVAALDEQIVPLLGDGGSALANALIDPPNGHTPVEVSDSLLRAGALKNFHRPSLGALYFDQPTYELP